MTLKLKALKAYIKMLNDTKFGNLETNRRALLEDIKGLDEIEEHKLPSSKGVIEKGCN